MNAHYPMMWSNACQAKVVSPHELSSFVKSLRLGGKTIATLNGSFDLLHAGHLQIIFEASQTADILIIALNTDHSIKRYKGNKRPIVTLDYRLQLMAALEFVDYVTWFDETDPRQLLTIVKPDVHVNGSEYTENCIEAETVKSFGGRLYLVPRLPGLATSALIKKIQEDI